MQFVFTLFALLALVPSLLGKPISDAKSLDSLKAQGPAKSSTRSFSAALAPATATSGPLLESIEPDDGVEAFIATLFRLSVQGIAFDKTIAATQFDKSMIPVIQAQGQAIFNTNAEATRQASALGYLNPLDSSRVTGTVVPLGPVFTHLVMTIAEQKATLCAMQYCKQMHDWLGELRVRALGLDVAVNSIVTVADAAVIESVWQALDREFPAILTEYHGPYV
ncbi:uncharacterized protein BO97DRAFT_419879 [Aspergillus homomorphus CBS 101889]|uniref:Uncharacterized protein n=1 Tax=Aspergillus homomorphus (strain CBS 101889) TaxID=1450537 RepID=A0A395IHF6_ASPHC|nr:hypothetical protein BO97DRAFT_419879 [Aspergillus homomorphus CBS 101889]RAL17644.1 hypothetical protein BO97DRAFT_419879 [Aspergillus homomorphus CBS 101889]